MTDKEIKEAIAKKEAQQQALPIRKRVNAQGRLKLFFLHEQKDREVLPVDAREAIEMGVATLTPIEMAGKPGRVKVAPEQVEEYKAKGYKPVNLEAEAEPETNDEETTKDDSGSDEVDYNKFRVSELKAMAQEAGIEGCQQMNKGQLTEALSNAATKDDSGSDEE